MTDTGGQELKGLRAARRRLVIAADADRRGIEAALHDGVQQDLIALAVDLRQLDGLVDADPAAARVLLAEMMVTIRAALDETTKLAGRIHPPLLEARGLASAIRSAATGAGVAVRVDAPPGAGYPPEVMSAVYWSCIEVLSSASPGSEATVTVRDADGALTFDITIDGHVPEARFTRLRDRVEAFDGGIGVEEGEPGGSRVHGWLPTSR